MTEYLENGASLISSGGNVREQEYPRDIDQRCKEASGPEDAFYLNW